MKPRSNSVELMTLVASPVNKWSNKSMDKQQQIPITYLSLPEADKTAIEHAYQADQHLYFILSPTHDMVKIGVAGNPIKRLQTLQSGNPAGLELLYVIPYGGYLLESLLHKEFKELRRRGEWFDYTQAIKDFITKAQDIAQEVGLIWKSGKVQHA